MKKFQNFLFLCLFISCFARPPIHIEPKNPNDPLKLPDGVNKSVLIIGGGLAGLSAAIELADRGYSVTIKEKEPYIGGKLFCKPVQIFPNETFYIEHGFHGWFDNYHQFQDIRDRLNINLNFQKWDKLHYVYRNYKPEVIYSEGPYPFNLIGIILRSPNLKVTDVLLSALFLPDVMYYEFDKIYPKYDNISFHQWVIDKHVAQDIYDIILQPALSVTLNERETYSAAEMLSYIQIFFVSTSNSSDREVTKTNYYDSVLKPWTDYLKKLNVKFLYNTEVKSLKIDSKNLNVYGTIDLTGDDQNVYDDVIFASEIGAVQNILYNTYFNYIQDKNIRNVLNYINNTYLGKLKTAPAYKVIRLWFDKQLNSSAPDILETPDFAPINLIAQYHQLEQEFIDWAKRTGGSVLEFHCYTWTDKFSENVTDDQVWGLISPTVNLIYPEIFERNFTILAYHVNSFKNFASFEIGSDIFRPHTDTLVKNNLNNIYLAGDWVKTDFPSALMERAVSTGRLAANEILLNDHVRQASLLVVNPKGPGI